MISRTQSSIFCVAIFLLATGCAGNMFSSSAPKQTKDLEQMGTRSATAAEEKRLDRCLYYIFKTQQSFYAKNRSYATELRALQPKENCRGLHLAMEPREEGFLTIASIRDDETAVRWTVDETGEVKEMKDLDLDFDF